MTPVTFNSGTQQAYTPTPVQKPGSQAGSLSGSSVQASGAPGDSLHLSPAALQEAALTGRVAADAQTGSLTADQAQQLYSQISTIHSTIAADRQADGGTLSPTDAQAIQQSQSQLSQTIYGDAHDGAAPPSDPTRAGQREATEAGRLVADQKTGTLSADQAQQLGDAEGVDEPGRDRDVAGPELLEMQRGGVAVYADVGYVPAGTDQLGR